MPVIFEEVAFQSIGSETSDNDDRWPRFTLNSVTVLSESTKELVSLFSGHKNHAVCVVGYLQEIPESHAHLVLHQSCTGPSNRLAVKNVTSWSCRRSPSDGSVEFNAKGKAGRYLIGTVATLYEAVFAQMTETASMYFFIEAKLRNMRKSVSELSDSYVSNYGRITFNEYLNSASNISKRQSVEDVKAGFHEYAEYIITMMLAAGASGSERLDWEASPMMRYFKQKCPEENAKVRSRMNPTGPIKLSFRPNFQRQESAPVRKQGKKPVQKEDDLEDTAGPAFPKRESSTEEQSTAVRRSTRRAAPRTKSSGLVSLHGLSDDFELLEDEVESNKYSSLSSEGKRHGPGTMPPPPRVRRRRDESREQHELAASPDPEPDADPDHTYHTSGGPSSTSRYAQKTLPTYELPNDEAEAEEEKEAQEQDRPGDRLWICEFIGCGFREYAADMEAGLERIKEHIRESHNGVGIENLIRDPRSSRQHSVFGYETQHRSPTGHRYNTTVTTTITTITTPGRRPPPPPPS